MNRSSYSILLARSLIAIVCCAILVTLCYFFVDRPVAFWVSDHRTNENRLFYWLQYPPPLLQFWAPAVLAALAIRRAWGPLKPCELTLLAACVSLLVAVQCEASLKFCFGRYWPETWTHENPSLLGSGAYGFHLFHLGPEYGSFPSGHMIRTLAIAGVAWVAYPRCHWACLLAALAVAIGLLGMNYHFVGNVIGGTFAGAIVGVYTAHACGLALQRWQPVASPGGERPEA